ncbi:MAG: glycosyltransferase [Saprospiraceae bacterium]
MTEILQKTVLLTPQHWGLGHVTRTIPVISYFVNRGWKVLLASSGAGSDLLKKEFPQLAVFELPDYNILYPSKNMYWNMAIQMYKMHRAIILEKFAIRRLCKEHEVDLLISDARLGAAQSKVPCAIITHHLHFPLKLKFFEWCADTWMRFFYLQFNEIWIPDFENEKNLSGSLSHQFKSKKHHYLGPLSRFKRLDIEQKFEVCFMLSGPEPARTKFEDLILEQFPSLQLQSAILIRGKSDIPSIAKIPNLQIISLATSEQLNHIMSASGIIVCRSGYSTLLDLSVIRKKALLIPTPGQPEQEYLGHELHRKKIFYSIDQDNLDLAAQIPLALECSGYTDFQENENLYSILDQRVHEIMKKK